MNTEVMQNPQLSVKRLLLLGLSSVVLCVSFLMSVFAPFPLALAVILYGRVKGYLTGLLGLGLSFAFATALYQDLTLFGFYGCVMIFGFAIAEIVIRGISPVKGLVSFGLGFILLVSGLFTFVVSSQNLTPVQFIEQQLEKSRDKLNEQKKLIEQSAQDYDVEALQLLDRPDQLARVFFETMPGYFFIGVFLMLWFNMFLVLKSRRLLLSGNDYPYSEKNLLNFKVPFGFVVPLAIGLALAVWGKDIGFQYSEMIGFTLIKCLGIFYFFQGFGVFSDLLSFLGIVGFFRVLTVMFVIFTGKYLIAAAGLFDNWFDFRKYFVKPKIED
jgi:MFS family permease